MIKIEVVLLIQLKYSIYLYLQTNPILTNAYRVFNSNFNPQKEDVNSFFSTLDVNRDNRVTLEDLENLCVRYLTGTTLGIPYKFQ